jgi:methanethiol S-methyltransferase
MRRMLGLVCGALGYLGFLLPIGYLVGFLADVGVPKSVDRGAGPWVPALWVDLGLLSAFGLQHSVMARPAFKRWLRRWIPPALERSVYCMASGSALALLFWLWCPIPAVLWDVSGTIAGALAWLGYAVGWGMAMWATFAVGHLQFAGVTQAAAHAGGAEPPRAALRTRVLYRVVRHPMTAGLLIAFWSIPRMTLGHLMFAATMTLYCLMGTALEERELLRSFPERYRGYRMQVPALVPFFRPRRLVPHRGAFGAELAVLGLIATAVPLWLLVSSARVSSPKDAAPLEREEILVGGHRRTYALFDPPTAASYSRPLVLALHGTGGSAGRLQGFLGGELERAAVRRGWMVAYPEALDGAWNDCRAAVHRTPRARGVDDVAYLRALIARLESGRDVNVGRVYVVGYSGGGHMGFRLALEAPELVVGVAAFAASLPTDEALHCTPRPGTPPVMIVNGTSDLVNPWRGGDVITPTGAVLGPVRSSEDTAAFLRSVGGGTVRLVVLRGGGHAVPGVASRFPRAVGFVPRTFEGVEEALKFLEAS